MPVAITKEKHGEDGPEHYSFVGPEGFVFEIYPGKSKEGSPIFFGISVPSLQEVVDRLQRFGYEENVIRDKHGLYTRDPDGNRVYLLEE